MAKFIDTRSSGSQLVILGESLVLPASNAATNATVTPSVSGSIRYNPTSDALEFVHNTSATWASLITPASGNGLFLSRAVDTWQKDSGGADRFRFGANASTILTSPTGGIKIAKDQAESTGSVAINASNTTASSGIVNFINNTGTTVGSIGAIDANKMYVTATGGRDINFVANAVLFNGDALATAAYVNNVVNGLNVHPSAKVGTTANITLSAPQTIDGIAVIAGDRVLVKNQTNNILNGLYIVAAGAWSRALDMDQPAEVSGASIWVDTGTVNGGTGWVGAWAGGLSSGAIGTDGIEFSQWGSWSVAGNAATISTGTLSDARLSSNVVLRNTTYSPTTDNAFDIGTSGTRYKDIFAYSFKAAATSTVASIIPNAHNTFDLGSNANRWANGYFANSVANAVTTGNVTTTADNTFDIGTSGVRFRNIYGVTVSATNGGFTTGTFGTINPTTDNSNDIGASAQRFRSIYAATLYGNAAVVGNVAVLSDNAYDVGTTASRPKTVYARTLTADAATIGNIAATADNLYSIGTTGVRFKEVNAVTFKGVATSAQYADLAERYHADAEYEPGTVLVIGGDNEVTVSTTAWDTRVAGIVSTAPAYMMNSGAGEDKTHPYVALRGRVPCKVIGPVSKGDLLVTSDLEGHAMKDSAPREGTVIGKALGDCYEISGVIEVLV